MDGSPHTSLYTEATNVSPDLGGAYDDIEPAGDALDLAAGGKAVFALALLDSREPGTPCTIYYTGWDGRRALFRGVVIDTAAVLHRLCGGPAATAEWGVTCTLSGRSICRGWGRRDAAFEYWRMRRAARQWVAGRVLIALGHRLAQPHALGGEVRA